MDVACEQVGQGIWAVDTRLLRPRMDASHLIIADGRAAFVDVGTSLAAPLLMQALSNTGIEPEAVEYIFLTHIHLDHAGGAGEMARLLPRAKVVLHPRAAAHMIDPSRLIEATQAVYGQRHFIEHYGQIRPIPAERIRVVEDGERLRLGSRTFEFLYTPGHALHHVSLYDSDAREMFTGDTFGISYREFDTAAGEFLFVTTSPTQFDPAQLHASVDRILALAPQALYLTHYSRVGQVGERGADMHRDIDASVRMAQSAAGAPDAAAAIVPQLVEHLWQRLDAHGCRLGDAERHALLDLDIGLNASGLAAWLSRRAGR
jgi:glyoxylase-like metal-dependent hydrolase (beta-lactamase superfamily II)